MLAVRCAVQALFSIVVALSVALHGRKKAHGKKGGEE
jgi:hypothetical protein